MERQTEVLNRYLIWIVLCCFLGITFILSGLDSEKVILILHMLSIDRILNWQSIITMLLI